LLVLPEQKEWKAMGTAQVQGDLWSAQARNWANFLEKFHAPLYKSVFDRVGVSRGTRLLDVGCGAGLAAQLAAELGAQVTGIDAAPAFIEIARERVMDGDFLVGDMEELPFAGASFDVVTGFNSFQHAANPVGWRRCWNRQDFLLAKVARSLLHLYGLTTKQRGRPSVRRDRLSWQCGMQEKRRLSGSSSTPCCPLERAMEATGKRTSSAT
jgi:SAM-dependent methyltransferase